MLGDGKSINVFTDKWLKGKKNLRVDESGRNHSKRKYQSLRVFLWDKKSMG